MNSVKRLFPYDSPQMAYLGIEAARVLAESQDSVGGSTEDYLIDDEKWW